MVRARLLYIEKGISKVNDAYDRWQSFWTPLWAAFFDGCCLDRPSHHWVADMKIWSESKTEGKAGEDPEMLFPHKLGWHVKEGGSIENRLESI
jgi:hypothetical protein